MSSPSPVPEAGTVRSDSAASTRDSGSLLAELASQAIVLLQRADAHTVVTSLLKEKSYLHTQNGQLWRLVDKQRAALLDLQKDYQKVLQEKLKYQARLKAQQRQDEPRPHEQTSFPLDVSALGANDSDANQSPSRRSSARSAKSLRPPRSPQPGAQLEALQASLEAEIAKSIDESVSAPSEVSQKAQDTHTPDQSIPPLIVNSSSSTSLSSKGKKVPTPLDLSPAKSRPSDSMPRSATFLAPRHEGYDVRNGRLSPGFRDPPPSAPPFQISNANSLSSFTRQTPPLRSPGLPKSPRPVTPNIRPISPQSAKVSDGSDNRSQDNGPPSSTQTSKSLTDEDKSDSSLSPTSPIITSPRDALIETARKSPLVPRRSRMPSHRSTTSQSHTSTSSSIATISGPTNSTPENVTTRASRSYSVESKQPLGTNLVPPEQYLERRRSRSFDDLQSLSNRFAQEAKSGEEQKRHPDSLTGIGLDAVIQEMRRENEKVNATVRPDSQTVDANPLPSPPKRAPPSIPVPAQPSPTALQSPFTARSRSSSNVPKPVTLAITPNDIPSVLLSVLSVRSRPKPIPSGPTEETLFTIRCRVRNTLEKSSDREILRIEKSLPQLKELGTKLTSIIGMAQFLNSFFDDFPVDKPDQRKAVDYFLGVVMGSPLDDSSLLSVAEFLSTDIVQKHDSQLLENRTSLTSGSPTTKSPTRVGSSAGNLKDGNPTKEGYLTKRGKKYGGWQTRYFVLDGPQLRYFDTPNGVHLGSIKLPQAQIGRHNTQVIETDDSGDEQMRYAFLILEPKRNDSSQTVRHVLCSQTDEDRDEWIEVLLHYVAMEPDPSTVAQVPVEKTSRGKRLHRRQEHEGTTDTVSSVSSQPTAAESLTSEPETIGIRYDQMAAGKRPAIGSNDSNRQSNWSQTSHDEIPRAVDPRVTRSPEQLRQPPPQVPNRSPYRAPISAPINGAPIVDEAAWNSAQREEERRKEEKRARKRSVWGFLSKDNRGRSTPEMVQATAPPPPALLQHGLFGISLRDAVDITREMGMGINVPSVVYRCIEYLEHMDAAKEEGIYRLSGSNSAIRMLKDRFNSEGDVDLVNSRDYHDVHAVAGLLKLYLRELPTTVLTRERHVDFLHISDIEDKSARVQRLSDLVHGLPKVNYELLRIMSKHLKRIVQRSNENKMTIRNVGIVFSPTLNIPAPVFSLFITEYEIVFDEPDDTPITTTPPAATESQNYVAYNDAQNQASTSHSNHNLAVQETSHRRYPSSDPSSRLPPAQPPPSFPLHNQGYRDNAYQQESYQQQSYQQPYQQYQAQQPLYHRGNTHENSTDLFG